MFYMWQEERGKPYYRFQTDEKELADKMKRREKFKLVSKGLNCYHWIYLATYTRPDLARKTFKALCGKVAILNKNEDIFQFECNISKSENSAA
jgi:hypothetical protein